MILAAHQLHYLPWLRYFHKLAAADVFVVLDNIQFNKNGWQNRNKIKSPDGPQLLTVPVIHKMAQSLAEVQIDTRQPWARKHWGSIQRAYQKARFFAEHAPFLEKIFLTPWEKLNDLSDAMFDYFVAALGAKTRVIKSSGFPTRGEASERLLNLCKDLGADTYLTGAFAAHEYLDLELFRREGVRIVFQEFTPPVYPQLFEKHGFISELSFLDLLLNTGPQSLEILMSSRAPAPASGLPV